MQRDDILQLRRIHVRIPLQPRKPRACGFVRLAAQARLRELLLDAVKLGIATHAIIIRKYLF